MKRNNVRIIGALLVMAICLVSVAPAMAVDWEQFHYDIANTGTTSSDAPDMNETLWVSDDIGAVMSSQAMIVGDGVYVYADDKVYALSKTNNGVELWNTSIPGDSLSYGSWASPVYSNGMLFVSGGYNLTMIDVSNGNVALQIAFPDGGYSCNGGPTVDGGMVFAGSGSGAWPNPGHYYAFYENNLTEKWNFTVAGSAVSTPAVAGNKIVFGEFIWDAPSRLYCVDAATGIEIWNTTFNKDVCGSAAIDAVNNRVYVMTYNDGLLHAISLTDGSEVWNATIIASDSTPAISDDYIYVSGSTAGPDTGRTYCFNSAGVEQWNVSCGSWTMSPTIADGKLFTGMVGTVTYDSSWNPTYYDEIGVYDAATGIPVWSYEHAGSPSSVANSDGIVVSIGTDGRVYAFGMPPTPPSEVPAIAPPGLALVMLSLFGLGMITIRKIGKSK